MKWKSVFSSELLHKVEIVKGVLEENGIAAVVVDKKDRSYQFGIYEVHVSTEQIMKAIKIINDDISFT